MTKWLAVALPIALLWSPAPANAEVDVPAALEEWRGWALHGKGYRNCPFLYNAAASAPEHFVCAWPGALALDLNAEGGTFSQRWTVYDEGPVPLPGDAERWPREVAVDGRAASVVLRDGVPTVWLPPGSYRLRGRFAWEERPATLPVPDVVGLVALVLDGSSVPLPQREDGLWLGAPAAHQAVADALSVDVFRRLEDGVPTRLETRLQLSVAGAVREERLGGVLPAGFVPLRLASELPVRLERDGQLLAQVRPGDWDVVLHARAAAVLDQAEMGTPGRNMPASEIWSFDARPQLRSTLAEGARPVDPNRAGSPWLSLPAFRLAPGEPLAVVERSRGQQIAANSLEAQRQLWLDFDRRGFTFADHITGAMRVDWRLDVLPPYQLLAATANERDLLITRNATAPSAAGVELRSGDLSMRALGRIEGRGAVPVAGWQSEMGMEATLHLPPGNRLLAAFGVDDAPSSWASQWRLLDFFVLLIVAIATVRLFGRVAGLIALVALILSFHEPGAPVWSWLNLLAAVALTRVAPPGRLLKMAKSYRLVSFAVLLLFLIPFGISQLRLAVYPQLEPASHRAGGTVGLFELLAGRPVVDEVAEVTASYIRRAPFDAPEADAADSRVEEVYEQAVMVRARDLRADATPAQVGAGWPAWEWAAHSLVWAGDVKPSRTMRLVIAPPWVTGLLRIVGTAALGLFAALLAFEILGRPWRWPGLPWARGAAAGALAALALIAVGLPTVAHAETPAPALLEDFERRLLEPPACAPACAEVVHAEVAVDAAEVAIDLEIHALAPVAVPLPGDVAGWLPASAALGDAAVPVQRYQDALWAQLPAGRHALALRGALPPGDAVEIPFPAKPRTVAVTATAWLVAGIEDGALPGGSLSLTRLRQARGAPPAAGWEASRFPAFVVVERTLRLGPRQWRVENMVRRVAPAVGAINLNVPLLAGEAIVSAERAVAGGRVAVAMAPAEDFFAWDSTLPLTDTVTLATAADQPWQDIWRLDVSPAWQVAFAGPPPSHGEADLGSPTFHPRPGETLAITVAQPAAVAGNTLAFDWVDLKTFAGRDGRRAELALDYRSTRGGSHAIRLPPGAVLESVAIDGEAESLPLVEGALNLPILPAAHDVRITWREDAASGLRTATPVVELGAPAANVATTLAVPERWLLFATGPALGPAVLYWSELLALVVASLVLGRIRVTPLKAWHWLLLGLGFSTFSWLAFGVVAGWLLVYGARERLVGALSRLWYNAAQIAFGLLALVAFAAILNSIPYGLLGEPDMSVVGYGADGEALRWFADKTASATPEAVVWSLPKWVYQALILAWAIWLTLALLRWLPWAWRCFSAGGLWQPKPAAPAPADKPVPSGEGTEDAGAPPAPRPTKDAW